MANNSFRDSVSSLGWSRRDPDIPVRTNASSSTPFLSRLQSLNPFSQGGYVQLPTHNEAPGAPLPASNRRDEEEGFFACKRKFSSIFRAHPARDLDRGDHLVCSPAILVTGVQFLRRERFMIAHVCSRGCDPTGETQRTLTASASSISMGSNAHLRCL